MNILFTCAGRRTYLLKYFREQLGCDGQIVATDMQLNAPALTAADVRLQVPAVYSPDYVNRTLDICRQYAIDAVISLNDLELPVLAAARDKFEAIGVRLIISSPEVIDICFDKYRTARFVESIGLKTPCTYTSLHDAKKALNEHKLKFPLVLKPRWGSGSIGIEFVKNMQQLEESYSLLMKKIKESILSTASDGDEYILIQEKIDGQEYGMDVMNDLEGNHCAVSVKRKIAMRAGETDKAQTVDNHEIAELGRILGENLRHIGNLDVDVFERDGQYYILELNPRFGGGFPFSYEAGVNFPGAIIQWLKGNDASDINLSPTIGVTFAKCDYLVQIQ